MRHWIIQANPDKKWNIFEWWESEDEPLDEWTLGWHAPQVQAGDRFALWVSGKGAGVYATGRIVGAARAVPEHESDPYWRDPPTGPVWKVPLDTELYLFDSPVRKADLARDPVFARALILRMPGYRNPIPIEPEEWSALAQHLPGGAARDRAKRRAATSEGEVVVTERRRGAATEAITVASPAQERTRSYREMALVAAYERFLGRDLPIRTARLPSGERLVIDGYDPEADMLIEAKASASRQDIRMAIGQLLDYRRHLAPLAQMVVLLPEAPSDDLVDLLRSLGIGLVIQDDERFRQLL